MSTSQVKLKLLPYIYMEEHYTVAYVCPLVIFSGKWSIQCLNRSTTKWQRLGLAVHKNLKLLMTIFFWI